MGGLTKTYHQNNTIVKAEIILLDKDKKGAPLSKDNMYRLALHEIGHSLGIVGHSPNFSDVMSLRDIRDESKITARDVNTLKLIYSNSPDNLALQKDILIEKLKAQENFVSKDPSNKLQLMILAGMYKNLEMYSESIKIDPNVAQAYYSLGVCYYKIGQKKKSLVFFKSAIEKEPDNIIFLKAFVKVCKETKNNQTARIYVNKYLEKYPDSKNDPVMKRILNEIK